MIAHIEFVFQVDHVAFVTQFDASRKLPLHHADGSIMPSDIFIIRRAGGSRVFATAFKHRIFVTIVGLSKGVELVDLLLTKRLFVTFDT